MTGAAACPACAAPTVRALARTAALPVMSNVYQATAALARSVPRLAMDLCGCDTCGLLFNHSFDVTRLTYDSDYETSLHHSARFRDYADALALALTSDLGAAPATVIEIGCGRGEFLALLTGAKRRCIGFDRSYDFRHAAAAGLVIRAHDFDADRDKERGDLVVCRHVLEHVADPLPMLQTLRSAAVNGGRVYVEVPNGLWTLRDGGVWDLIYEHCTYFTPRALAIAARRAGLGVIRTSEAFGAQFLQLWSTTGAAVDDGAEPPSEAPLLDRFADRLRATLAAWGSRLGTLRAGKQRVAAWGAGSKAVTFLNAVPGADAIELVVDLNPRKQGRHVPGTGQRIVAPSALRAHAPDVVLVMNPQYRDEIGAAVRELGLDRCAIECVS